MMSKLVEDTTLVHPLIEERKSTVSVKRVILFLSVAVFLGVVTGFGVYRLFGFSKSTGSGKNKQLQERSKVKKTIGIKDPKTFSDKAEGILKEGGIDGEGSFHLERSGGESQNAYLTSTTVDLSVYVNRKVRVWGETFKGEKAGWLMDVGFVEVLD